MNWEWDRTLDMSLYYFLNVLSFLKEENDELIDEMNG